MPNKTCDTCMWWQTLKEYNPQMQGTKDSSGVCRRMSPGVIGNQYRDWPGTLITDWCGEWKEGEDEH